MLTLVVSLHQGLSLVLLLQTQIQCPQQVLHSRGHLKMQVPVRLGTHLRQDGMLQATLGQKRHHRELGALLGQVKDGLIRSRPKGPPKDQGPKSGPKKTRKERIKDGEGDQQRPGIKAQPFPE